MKDRDKITDTTEQNTVKPGPREHKLVQECPMRTNALKQRPQEVTNPIPESILEEVSDDLVLLRCRLCELNMPDLAAFCPEPWFNEPIILERLSEIVLAVDRYMDPGPCRESLQEFIDRIKTTIEEATE